MAMNDCNKSRLSSTPARPFFITKEYKDRPANAPRYKSPAKAAGGISLTSNCANGGRIPNSDADITINIGGFLSILWSLEYS